MTIAQKAEQALRTYLVAASTTPVADASVFTGVEDDAKVLPCVIIRCLSVEVVESGLGIWRARVQVAMLDNADDTTEATHKTNTDALFALIARDDIPAILNAQTADHFHAFYAEFDSMQQEIVDRSWQSTVGLSLVCSGEDIS